MPYLITFKMVVSVLNINKLNKQKSPIDILGTALSKKAHTYNTYNN